VKLNSRCFQVLYLRKIISDNEFMVILRYDGDSSKQVNDFRYHLLNNNSNMVLITSNIVSSVFQLNGVQFLNNRIFVLYSEKPSDLALALKKAPQFLDHFPFIAFAYRGFLSQKFDIDIIINFNPSYFLNFYVLVVLFIYKAMKAILFRMLLTFKLVIYSTSNKC
jgi:hypothetical protein